MATGSPELVKEALANWKVETSIDWQRMFPSMLLGPHCDPRKLAEKIRTDVGKLKSCSDAGRRSIVEERCARVGVSPDGVPTFYIGRTKAV